MITESELAIPYIWINAQVNVWERTANLYKIWYNVVAAFIKSCAKMIMQVNVNLAGLPALVVPCGFVEGGTTSLPVGLQIIGPAFTEVSSSLAIL